MEKVYILIVDEEKRNDFDIFEDLVRYVYEAGIREFAVRNTKKKITGYFYNPDRYWFAEHGVPYRELFDEDPDWDFDED